MIYRIIFIVIGILVVFSGVDIFFRQAFYYFGVDVKLENSRYVAVLVIIFGVFFIVTGLKKQFSLVREEKYYKCVKCGLVVGEYIEEDCTCPKCGAGLEDLNGFFNRHPDQK
jgi:hypothetical protein